jgi:hypothetical protein
MLPTFELVAIGLFSFAFVLIIGLSIKFIKNARKKYEKI